MKIISYIEKLVRLAALVLPLAGTEACSDHLFDDLIDDEETAADGIGFRTRVVEQADLLYCLGQTRTSGFSFYSLTIAANTV